MKPERMVPTAIHISTFKSLAEWQWSSFALLLAILLGLTAVPPDARAQTMTVLYSFEFYGDGVRLVRSVE